MRYHFFRDPFKLEGLLTASGFILELVLAGKTFVNTQTIWLCRFACLGRLVKLVRTIEPVVSLYLIVTAHGGTLRIPLWSIGLFVVTQLIV